MEALAYQNYNGVWYVCGQDMQVESEGEAADMVALHLAKRKAPTRVPVQPDPSQLSLPLQPERRDVSVESDPRSKKDKKQRYKHREMRVDES
jgi:hypothetical protein